LHTNYFIGKLFFCRETLQLTVARKRGRWVYERGEVESAEKEESKDYSVLQRMDAYKFREYRPTLKLHLFHNRAGWSLEDRVDA
jgi:hypothetical protein